MTKFFQPRARLLQILRDCCVQIRLPLLVRNGQLPVGFEVADRDFEAPVRIRGLGVLAERNQSTLNHSPQHTLAITVGG
jgi:hypothetical protein